MLYTRLGRSSLEVCYIYPCCSVCAIYPCCTPRHLPSCAMPSRWDCQPALKLSSKCGCSCSPQLIPPIGATLSEWTVLSHLIETDLPFATLMLTHNGTQCPYICRHPKILHRLSFAMPAMPAVTVLCVASSWPSWSSSLGHPLGHPYHPRHPQKKNDNFTKGNRRAQGCVDISPAGRARDPARCPHAPVTLHCNTCGGCRDALPGHYLCCDGGDKCNSRPSAGGHHSRRVRSASWVRGTSTLR